MGYAFYAPTASFDDEKDGSTVSVLIASSGLFDEAKNFVQTRCFTILDPHAA